MVKNSRNKSFPNQQTKAWSRSKKKDAKPQQDEHLEQIPFQLRRIMKMRAEMNMGSNKLKKMRRADKPKAQTGVCEQEDIKVPQFRRGKKESEVNYLQRMSQAAQHVLFLTKNQPERRPEHAPEDAKTSATSDKATKKKKRWMDKKKAKQQKNVEINTLADKVEFGEVAMAPPSLTVKPKKAPVKTQSVSSSLLLSSILGHTDVSTAKPSMARRRIIEEEHDRVVHAYRQMKKMKRVKTSDRNATS